MKRSKFSLSHYKLLTCKMGNLIPCGCFEVLPGDTIQQATSALIRVTPLVAPVMHPVHVKIHHWFVPLRIIWDDFEKFITGGDDGAFVPSIPNIATGVIVKGSLADYLGLVPGAPTRYVSALPFRAYNLIFNEWYRDQDLISPLVISKASGLDSTTSKVLASVAWEKDYFTTARPWTQKGPDVSIPLGTFAPVEVDPTYPHANTRWLNRTTGAAVGGAAAPVTASATLSETTVNGIGALYDPTGSLRADLSSATAANINDLRRAFALQRYEEARARYGSRYVEYLRYLGVRSSDARLQRPEYLGGGKQTIQFSEVLQTAPVDGAGVGNLSGHGIGAMRSNRYRRFFEEHGLVLSLMSVKPKTMYAQGEPRMWWRPLKEDYFQKELQHIGQQEVYKRELYAGASDPNAVFGYQDRYDEYRRMESSIAGDFRDTMDHWHYARIFGSEPTLNGAFVQADPTNRVYQEQTADPLWIMANHSIQARRMVAGVGSSHIF